MQIAKKKLANICYWTYVSMLGGQHASCMKRITLVIGQLPSGIQINIARNSRNCYDNKCVLVTLSIVSLLTIEAALSIMSESDYHRNTAEFPIG